jgi:transcriptional regulator with GAF, ATPase, and Fis domain
MGRRIEAIPAAIMDALVSYPWPGNVRERVKALFRCRARSRGVYSREGIAGIALGQRSSATQRIMASAQMKFTTLLPMRFNDGRDVPAEQISQILDELALQFGGCSDEGITKGQWLDPKDRTLYRDESRRVSVSCDNRLLFEAQQVVVRIGRELGQRAMYFEVRDYDGVQILEVPAERQET